MRYAAFNMLCITQYTSYTRSAGIDNYRIVQEFCRGETSLRSRVRFVAANTNGWFLVNRPHGPHVVDLG